MIRRVASHHLHRILLIRSDSWVLCTLKGRGLYRWEALGVVLDCAVNAPSILQILCLSKEPEEEMAEAAIDSNEDLSQETEDLEPLERDDGGKKDSRVLAFLSHLDH